MQKLAAIISVLILASGPLHAATIHVPADQTTIQAGIDAASAGDTVLVACGHYTWASEDPGEGVYSLLSITPGIVLIGSSESPDLVVIDASGIDLVIKCEPGVNQTIIEGFTITGGNNGPGSWGGGIHCSNANVRIAHCVIHSNTAGYGGGLFCYSDTEAIVEHCNIYNNSVDTLGGAIYTNDTSITLTSCRIHGNGAVYNGGALEFENYSSVEMTLCTLSENYADWGGAIGLHISSPMIYNCTFWGNVAAETGGCIWGGNGCYPFIRDSVLWGNIPDEINLPSSIGDVQCSSIEGGWPGDGNISHDPLFCDSDMDDFHLRNDSPCAPENNDCEVLMGAWRVGCSTSAESVSWSEIKGFY